MGLPDALTPCLSSSAVSALNDSIRASNAESQLALPFIMTTFFGSSENCSPKGSAVWTGAAGGGGAGVWAAEGVSAGDLVSAGGGAGVAEGAGLGDAEGEAAGVGDCASVGPASASAANGASATRVARKVLIRLIFGILHPHPWRPLKVPVTSAKVLPFLTRQSGFRPMTDASCA